MTPTWPLIFLSSVTGVDYLDKEITEKVKVTHQVLKTVDGVERVGRGNSGRDAEAPSSLDISSRSITSTRL